MGRGRMLMTFFVCRLMLHSKWVFLQLELTGFSILGCLPIYYNRDHHFGYLMSSKVTRVTSGDDGGSRVLGSMSGVFAVRESPVCCPFNSLTVEGASVSGLFLSPSPLPL